jgi:hypothetical protein
LIGAGCFSWRRFGRDIPIFDRTYERRPGYWRAAITPVKPSVGAIIGKTTSSFVTPDDFDSESDAKFAAEKISRKL